MDKDQALLDSVNHAIAMLQRAIKDPGVGDEDLEYVKEQLDEAILALVGMDGYEQLNDEV